MPEADTLIYARWILPISPHNSILENHAIAINKGRITAILPVEQFRQWQAAEEVKLSDEHVLMPGLINTHAHSPMNLFKGLADDLPLMDWLQQHIWPAEQAILNEESMKDGVLLAILEMIRGGTTCFCDHYFFHETIAQAAVEAGMRANVGLWIGSVPTLWANNEAEYFAKVEKTLTNNRHPDPLISWSLAPHSPYIVSEHAFKKMKGISEQYQVPIHIHLHETEAEIEQCLKQYQRRPIQWLHDLGLLSRRLIAVHMTQLTDEEIQMIKQGEVSAVHCPESNLKLASGFCPVSKLVANGINVSIGTDGAASNNDLDMFAEMQTAALLAKAVSCSATAVPAPQALAMATINGAKAFGLDHEIGSLEVGKWADIIAIDLSSYLTQPVYNPMSTLVYAVDRQQVSDVWIAGKRLLKNKEFTQLDSQAIISKAKQWAKKAMPFRSKAVLN